MNLQIKYPWDNYVKDFVHYRCSINALWTQDIQLLLYSYLSEWEVPHTPLSSLSSTFPFKPLFTSNLEVTKVIKRTKKGVSFALGTESFRVLKCFVKPEVKEKRSATSSLSLVSECWGHFPPFGFTPQSPLGRQTTVTTLFPVGPGIEESREGAGKDDLTCKTPGLSPT